MAAGQQWLFAPARPLVERLGKQFFRTVPPQPGVYLMRDATGDVVYVGKAKNLRQRLRSYRVANPERMPRRHLRMVREVARIDFGLCPNESAALASEARLLHRLKPKFNRAGVWPGKAQFLSAKEKSCCSEGESPSGLAESRRSVERKN
jgi:predicted GIY-YIG superfamily endonuclease